MTGLVACSAIVGGWVPAAGQVRSASERPPSAGPGRDRSGEPTAEDVLRALQRSRPSSDLLQPEEATTAGSVLPDKLLPEGTSLVDRTGHLERRDDGWVFVPSDAPPGSALPLLRNATLEVAIRTAAGASDATSFLISGEVTVFRGSNHLLLRSFARVRAPSPASADQNPGRGDERRGDTGESVSPPSAAEVWEALRAQKPAHEATEDDTPDTNRGSTASHDLLVGFDDGTGIPRGTGAELRRTLRPDGSIFARRTGRFITQGDRWLFVPESDHPDHPDPPVELLPCQATESMALLWKHNPHGLVFVVSGELTLFNGVNYLLPRLAIRQLASDNLRK